MIEKFTSFNQTLHRINVSTNSLKDVKIFIIRISDQSLRLATLDFLLLILGLELFWTITNRFGRVQFILERLKSF